MCEVIKKIVHSRNLDSEKLQLIFLCIVKKNGHLQIVSFPLRIPCVHVVEKKIQIFVFILELDMIVLTYPYLLHTK